MIWLIQNLSRKCGPYGDPPMKKMPKMVPKGQPPSDWKVIRYWTQKIALKIFIDTPPASDGVMLSVNDREPNPRRFTFKHGLIKFPILSLVLRQFYDDHTSDQ